MDGNTKKIINRIGLGLVVIGTGSMIFTGSVETDVTGIVTATVTVIGIIVGIVREKVL